jgi:molybdopterin molybdotransferase
VRVVIRRRGTLDIWPLAVKPGRPVDLGDIDACPILALPGNPVAAAVAFAAFGRAVVNALSGALDEPPRSLMLPANLAMQKNAAVRQFLPAHVRRAGDGASIVVPCDKQGAAAWSTLAIADGFVVLARIATRPAGRLGRVSTP